MRNTHKTIAQSVDILKDILELADRSNKEVVVYISMGFGNPYGDPWNVDIVGESPSIKSWSPAPIITEIEEHFRFFYGHLPFQDPQSHQIVPFQ